jgi:hypothetical protein
MFQHRHNSEHIISVGILLGSTFGTNFIMPWKHSWLYAIDYLHFGDTLVINGSSEKLRDFLRMLCFFILHLRKIVYLC